LASDRTTSRYSGISVSAFGGGRRDPPVRRAAMYANSKAVTAMPRATSKGVIVSKNGELIPAPAPWARRRRHSAFAGPASVMTVRVMSYLLIERAMLGSRVIPERRCALFDRRSSRSRRLCSLIRSPDQNAILRAF
jgi:hypothetical protein